MKLFSISINPKNIAFVASVLIARLSSGPICIAQEPAAPIVLWPSTAPGDDGLKLENEIDLAVEKPSLVAGKNIMRIANVSQPTIQIYKPPKELDTGTSVVICPGGGYQIVAYDLEGTEVAKWLNSIGVTGIVVKYRVPARKEVPRWQAAVQDAQRAIRLTRANAKAWGIEPDRIGILGFSAGGDMAARTTLLKQPQYDKIDSMDEASHLPNFTILIYPAYLYDPKTESLVADLKIDQEVGPTFLVHALNDGVTADSSIALARALKSSKRSVELHLFDRGGHGYGLRKTENPVTEWPKSCEAWLRVQGLLVRKDVKQTP